MKTLVIAICGLLAAAPALAQGAGAADGTERAPSSEASASSGASRSDAERQICRRIQEDTGTRIAKTRRLCMTAREWREFDRQN